MLSSYHTQFEKVVERALSGAVVLTANTRSARAVVAECDRRLSAKAAAWETPAVLPLTAWLQQVWREAQARGTTEKVLLSPLQQLKSWEQIIERGSNVGELLRPSSAAPAAVEAWRLLHAYRISRTSSAFAVSLQTREFSGWSNAHEAFCRDRGLIDDAVLADEVDGVLASAPALAPPRIAVWGFDEIVPQVAALLERLRQTGVECEVIDGTSEERAAATRAEFSDSEREFEAAAQWARAQLESDPRTRVGIVVPGLAGARSDVERIFLRELNPEFFAGDSRVRAFDISLGPKLGSYLVIRAAVLALRWMIEPLAFCEIRELLLSPYLGGAEQESSSRAQLVIALSTLVSERVALSRLVAALADKDVVKIACPQLKAMLRKLAVESDALPTRAPWGEWTRTAYDLLGVLGWPGESAGHPLDSTEYQTTEKWRDLLSEVASLELISPPCSSAAAFKVIASRAAAATFAPENRLAPVQILGETEAAGSVFDALWVCGLTDEAWPPRRNVNAFLPAALQQQAGVPGSSSELTIATARLMLQRLVDSATCVVLSSARNDGDRELRVSNIIERFPAVDSSALALSRVQRWEELPVAECEELVDACGPSTTNEQLKFHGTSVIEGQSLCPFRAFAEWRLRAKQLQEPSPGIRLEERGKLVERTLELVWLELRDHHVLLNTAESDLQTIIENSVETAIGEQSEDRDPLRGCFRAIERDRLVGLVREWLEVERLREKFEVIWHQQGVKFDLGGMTVSGKVDRVDRVDGGFVVIDYKTGADYKAGHWKLPRPRRPQLPLYAIALQREGKEVVGLSFAIVRTGECEFAGGAVRPKILGKNSLRSRTFMEERDWTEMFAAWEKEFAKLAAAHLAGRAEVDPKDPPRTTGSRGSSCEHCHLGAFCRVAELNLAVDTDDDGGDDEQA